MCSEIRSFEKKVPSGKSQSASLETIFDAFDDTYKPATPMKKKKVAEPHRVDAKKHPFLAFRDAEPAEDDDLEDLELDNDDCMEDDVSENEDDEKVEVLKQFILKRSVAVIIYSDGSTYDASSYEKGKDGFIIAGFGSHSSPWETEIPNSHLNEDGSISPATVVPTDALKPKKPTAKAKAKKLAMKAMKAMKTAKKERKVKAEKTSKKKPAAAEQTPDKDADMEAGGDSRGNHWGLFVSFSIIFYDRFLIWQAGSKSKSL
jgi:hypothetical protein